MIKARLSVLNQVKTERLATAGTLPSPRCESGHYTMTVSGSPAARTREIETNRRRLPKVADSGKRVLDPTTGKGDIFYVEFRYLYGGRNKLISHEIEVSAASRGGDPPKEKRQ